MNQVTFTVNGKELVFTETEMRFANREFPYVKIGNVTHRDGEKPAFIFEFDGKRLALPYNDTDKEDIANLFTKIIQMNQNCESKIQLPELQEIEELGDFGQPFENPSVKEYDFKNPKTHVILTDDYISLIRGDHDMMIHKSLRGETRLYYKEILSLKFKNPTLTSKGVIEFKMPQSSLVGAIRSNQLQNSIFFKKDKLKDAIEVKAFVDEKLRNK